MQDTNILSADEEEEEEYDSEIEDEDYDSELERRKRSVLRREKYLLR